jgi:hypothetical protein
VHRMACAEEVYDALRTSWREFCDSYSVPLYS